MTAAAPVRAHGGAPMTARLRASPEDFQVIEQLGFDADGSGEHVLLRVRKRGLTTQQAAEILARHAGVKPLAVGYAGMKDRHAVTEQAFTVQLAGRVEPDWQELARDDIEVLDSQRHRRKLKRGALKGNAFVIVLREVSGERAAAERVLAMIRDQGVPNYYGEQRFGRRGDNIEQARAMFGGRRVKRHQRGILLSAVRSHLFNQLLERRVAGGNWNRAIGGEIFCLAGSRAWFGPEALDEVLAQRLASGDIHPSGPLWGKGDSPAEDDAAALENILAAEHPDLVRGLAEAGLEHDRRALRLVPRQLQWQWRDSDTLELRFQLPAGGYATTVIRELASTSQERLCMQT